MRSDAQSMTGRIVPLCLLVMLAVAIGIVLVAYFSLGSGRDKPVLDLGQAGPFQASDQAVMMTSLASNPPPEGLSYQLEDKHLVDFSFRSTTSEPPFTLFAKKVEVVALDQDHWPPLFTDLRLQDFELTLEDQDLPPWLARISGDALVTYRLNPESQTLDLPQWAVQVPGLGLATGSLSLDGIDPMNPLGSLSESAVSTLSITLEDEGVIGLALAYLAKQEGLSEETLRQNLSALATFLQSESGFPFLREFLQAVKAVVETRSKGLIVSLSATPERSFPIARLSQLSFAPIPNLAVLQDLNLRIDTR